MLSAPTLIEKKIDLKIVKKLESNIVKLLESSTSVKKRRQLPKSKKEIVNPKSKLLSKKEIVNPRKEIVKVFDVCETLPISRML